MNEFLEAIKKTEIQDFIESNLDINVQKFLLKKNVFDSVENKEIVHQIQGHRIASKKFPFLNEKGFVFPPHLNLEQSSSEETARFKAESFSGNSLLDLTCGFGIDAYFISKNFKKVTLVEQNQELLKIVQSNWGKLEKEAAFICLDSLDFLMQNEERFDWIYLDPARRDKNQRKIFLLEDLSPNFLEIQDDLFKISDKICIKLSPLIDLNYLVSELKKINQIDIISVKNDVKEVLVYLNQDKKDELILCRCVNLETNEPIFSFQWQDLKKSQSCFSEPKRYLYLPNHAVLKSGAFNLISERFGLAKLHENTHIYTSESYIDEFPGRILEVEEIGIKELKKGQKFNIISKNYPLKPEEIKKKFKIQDGGIQYLIFTQSKKGKIVLKSI